MVQAKNKFKNKQCITKNVKENRTGNQEWIIQKYQQHWVHNTKDEVKLNKKNTTKKTKKRSKTAASPKNPDDLSCSRSVTSSCHFSHKVKSGRIYGYKKNLTLFCVLLVVLYGGCGIGMAFMAMNLGGTVLQVIYIYIE
jgi:septum formation inhibitor MinC